ncbi:MAG: archease [Candidatus Marinimicrobia bacterium]|nr:archease [Candidatus Neomarinimicrobiota bacterium]
MKKFYRQFNQTSDLGIEVSGSDLQSLYRNAALCLSDLITDIELLKKIENRIVTVQAEDRELLLREFLAELLYLFNTYNFLSKDITIIKISENELEVALSGDQITIETHPIYREIKSVTYHHLFIKHTDSGYKARFVLDI